MQDSVNNFIKVNHYIIKLIPKGTKFSISFWPSIPSANQNLFSTKRLQTKYFATNMTY